MTECSRHTDQRLAGVCVCVCDEAMAAIRDAGSTRQGIQRNGFLV